MTDPGALRRFKTGAVVAIVVLLAALVFGGVRLWSERDGGGGPDEPVDGQVRDLLVVDGTWYAQRMTWPDDPDWGTPELWRSEPGGGPVLVSQEQAGSCGGDVPVYQDWHRSPGGAAMTTACWSAGRFSVWEYQEGAAAPVLVHEADAAAGQTLFYAAPDRFYRLSSSTVGCTDVEVETAAGEATPVAAVIAEAAGAAATAECPVPLASPSVALDGEGDLWAAVGTADSAAACEYDLDAGTAECAETVPGPCWEFEVSRDGTRFACGGNGSGAGSEGERLQIAVYETATAAPAGEAEIPASGSWAFADDETILHVGDGLEAQEYGL